MAKFVNSSEHIRELVLGGVLKVVKPQDVLEVDDALVLDEGHNHDVEGHTDHDPAAMVFPSSIWQPADAATAALTAPKPVAVPTQDDAPAAPTDAPPQDPPADPASADTPPADPGK